MRWTLEQLRTFVEVSERGSMTAAAHELGYTPGAVSQQMQALRSAVGQELFVRDGRGIELSDDGRTLLRHASELLDAERAAVRALAGPAAQREARVDLGVFGSAAVAAMRPAMTLLAESAPSVIVRANEVDVELMPQAVATGRIDLALGLAYSAVPTAMPRGVTAVPLRREPFLLVLPPGTRSPGDDAGLLRLAASSAWILPPMESDFGRAMRLACADAGIEPNVAHVVTDTAVSLAMTESGLGLTLATDLMLRLHPGMLVAAPLPGGATRDIIAITRRGSLARASVRSVLEALQRVFAIGSGFVGEQAERG